MAPKSKFHYALKSLKKDDKESIKAAQLESVSLEKNLKEFIVGEQTNHYKIQSSTRKAFEVDPNLINIYASVYQPKQYLVPDVLLKRVSLQDPLIAIILQVRANQISMFGRPQKDRFAFGYKITIKPQLERGLKSEKRKEILEQIEKASKLLYTCGHLDNLNPNQYMTFPQFLRLSIQDGLLFGRFATEIIQRKNAATQQESFGRFRPVDSGTIYFATHGGSEAQAIRNNANKTLDQIFGKINEDVVAPIVLDRWRKNEYSYIQVINGKPLQAFTDKELIVHNLFPTTNVDLVGYPPTPIDKVINDVITHLNITTYNKMYFQSGRATKGMMVIKSSAVDDEALEDLRQHFNASINSAQNAWRAPIFNIGPDDEINWQPLDTGQKDMEFQYLYDSNIRIILSAFQMDPVEIPGYAYLSRGTQSQALSETSNSYQLEAARDAGIKPLLLDLQDFINHRIFPLIAPELAEICYVDLLGLDKVDQDKESQRLQIESQLHMTPNELYSLVEKEALPDRLGGNFPMNPAIKGIIENYVPYGVILEEVFGVKGAALDPKYQFIQNTFWYQWIQFLNQLDMQKQQMDMQAKQMQAEAQQQAQQPAPGGGDQASKEEAGDDQAQKGDQSGKQSYPVSEVSSKDISFNDVMGGLEAISKEFHKSEAEVEATRQLLKKLFKE